MSRCIRQKHTNYAIIRREKAKSSLAPHGICNLIRNVLECGNRDRSCRKPNLSHNEQLPHASPRAHKNMKHTRILENRKTRKSFWRCSWDFLGPLRNQHGTTHYRLRACLHGGRGPQVGEVTRLGGVTRLSI